MLKIDAHQHFWKYDAARDAWITDSMKVIQRDFLPEDLEPVLKANGIDGCVVVQSDQSSAENIFQINHGLEHSFIKGIVGWVNLQATDIAEQLSYLSHFEKLKGFRHILQGEKDRALMLKKKFMNGIRSLSQYHFTYDILIFPDQLRYAKQLAEAFPNQKFVINHIAKPDIKNKHMEDWKQDMQAISKCQNVYCKISGMVTEADREHWHYQDFVPYLDVVTEAFGMQRLLYGSDWPVCLLAATYAKMKSIVESYFHTFSEDEKNALYGGNAIAFYNL